MSPRYLRGAQRALLYLLLLILGSFTAPVLAQPGVEPLGLLVVVPERMPLDATEVDRWIERLKNERERQGLTPEELPLLRLSYSRATHRTVLERLGLDPSETVRTFTCRRDERGWPSQVLAEHQTGTTADQILSRVLKNLSSQTVSTDTLGILLVADAQAADSTEPFLRELGRFWLQRYGRVRPSPFPLASYDVGQVETAEALRQALPKLMEGPLPLLALCAFREGQPVEVLQLFRGFDTPASLVREISAARGQALAAGGRAQRTGAPGSLPGPRELALSAEQERVLLVSRLHETAQQLWNSSKGDASQRQHGPNRILLRVIEESRRFIDGDSAAYGLLLESLRDYAVEPHSTGARDQASRLSELSRALLQTEPEP